MGVKERTGAWIVEFTQRLRAAGDAGGPAILREAEEALGKLSTAQVRAQLQDAERSDVDPRLARWLHERIEPAESREQRQSRAFFEHLRGAELADQGGAALEAGLQLIEKALAQVVRAEAVETWSQMQHNLAETLMQREGGARAENVERAVVAFRAALPGRVGGARVDTLVGLAQALRKRLAGNVEENAGARRRALADAERLLEKHGEPKRMMRVLLERATGEQESQRFEAALELVKQAAKQAPVPEMAWHLRDREATVLAAWAVFAPERREEALAMNHALLLEVDTQTMRRTALVRSRLRALGAPAPPLTPDVLGHHDIHWWKDDLGEAPLAHALMQALDLRIRREEREAFRLPSGRALVRRESDLAPLVLRLAVEHHGRGDDRRALAYLAHLGAWPLRRALRWTDFAGSANVEMIRQSRILEDRLTEVLLLAQFLDLTNSPPPPTAPGSAERVRRYLSGASDEAFLTPDDLMAPLSLASEERSSAVAELRQGIESGVEQILGRLAIDLPPMFNSVTLPPFIRIGTFAENLPVRQALVILQNVDTELVLGAVWRSSDGMLLTMLTRAPSPTAASAREFPFAEEIARLAETLHQASIERVGLMCRGAYARLMATAVAPLATGRGTRLVHLPGFDDVSLPPLDRTRSRRYLVLLDPAPDRALPCIVLASETLREAGFLILRPGETLDHETATALADAHGVIFAGHGLGTIGPLGPTVGRQFVSHFDQLPLRASAWALCMACSVGDSARPDDLIWDHDDPAGAAEHLLLAGCRHAADCLTPVPEVLAALVLEEFGVRTADGEEPEATYATTAEGWRSFFASLSEPLAERLVDGAALDAPGVSAWLTRQLDAERRRRLRREVGAFPPEGLFASLGTRAPATPSAGAAISRDAIWAREMAAQTLAPLVSSSTWAAFRWMARR